MQTAEVIEAPTLEPIIRALNRISDELESIVEHSREESEPAHELSSATKHFATLLINHSFDELPDILKGIVDDLQHIAPVEVSPDDISAMVKSIKADLSSTQFENGFWTTLELIGALLSTQDDLSDQTLPTLVSTVYQEMNGTRLEFAKLLSAFCEHWTSQGLPLDGHHARLSMFIKTNGVYNHAINWLIARYRPAPRQPSSAGVLGLNEAHELIQFRRQMKREGYHLFSHKVPQSICEEITEFSHHCPGIPVRSDGVTTSELSKLSEINCDLDGFRCDEGLILQSKAVLDLIADGSFLSAARSYLNCEPVFANANLWWSFPANASIGRQSEMAQLMHYDGNWNHFINIFIYLSDVDQQSGPHTFIRRSHVPNNRPRVLLDRGYQRISDQELAQYYPVESFCSVVGQAGTVFAGDTRCWHRGSHPEKNPRLVLQLLYTDTLASGGGRYRFEVERNKSSRFSNHIAENQWTYQGIKLV